MPITLPSLRSAISKCDLTLRQLTVLLLISESLGPLYVRDLARELKCPRASISRALDQLGQHQFVRRVRPKDDRRNVYGELTDEGREFVQMVAV